MIRLLSPRTGSPESLPGLVVGLDIGVNFSVPREPDLRIAAPGSLGRASPTLSAENYVDPSIPKN